MNLYSSFGKVLIIAAHADDETLGCGGTISKLRKIDIDCHVHVVTGHGKGKHPLFDKNIFENIKKEFKKANLYIGGPKYSFGNLPAAMLNDIPTHFVNDEIKKIIDKIKPNTIFIPSRNDLHLDHKIVNYASRVACRPYLKNNSYLTSIIEYEVPSETNIYHDHIDDLFTPNLYIDITKNIQNKINAFSEYKSQIQELNQPRSISGINALASFRGINIGVEFAESFNIIFKKF